jgi:hypothetical protein
MEADADEPLGDDEILDAAMRCERRAERVRVHARDEEVGVLRLETEELVADGAPDEICVQAEPSDVVLDLAEH